MSTNKGLFSWYELMTNDVAGAKRFYPNALGWSMQDWEDPSMEYTMWQNAHGPVGGLMKLPKEAADMGAPPHWMGYIHTPDTDATLAQAEQLGATVFVRPMDIPDVGRFATLADPTGAAFSLFTPATDHPPMPNDVAGAFGWHELGCTDHAKAFAFYQQLFGWEKMQEMDMGGGMIYLLFGLGGKMIGGMYTKGPEMPGPSAWLYYVTTDDIDAALTRIRESGGKVLNGPMEVPGGDRVAQCQDPQGVYFAVVGPGEK